MSDSPLAGDLPDGTFQHRLRAAKAREVNHDAVPRVVFGIAGAALVLAATLPRRWAIYSATTGCAALLAVFVWGALPYPWVGTAERVLALILVGWAAALGTRITSGAVRPTAASGQTQLPHPGHYQPSHEVV